MGSRPASRTIETLRCGLDRIVVANQGRRMSYPKRGRSGVTLIEIIVVLGILLLVLAFALPFLFRVRGQAESARGRNNLQQLGIAAHNYHDVYNVFPPIVGVDPNG